MAVFSRIKTWVSNEVLTAADLNAEFNNILNNMDPEGIEDASATVSDMQATSDPGGVGSESLSTDLLGEIKRLRYKIKQMIGGSQWYSTPVGSLSAGGIDTATLADAAVTTVKIEDAAVTQAKRASLGHQISSSSGSFTRSSAGRGAVTNLSVTITTTGRPVVVQCIHDGGATSGDFSVVEAVGNQAFAVAHIVRDSTTIARHELNIAAGGASSATIHVPVYSVGTIDVPPAGTYTYTIEAEYLAGDSVSFNQAKLIAYEL